MAREAGLEEMWEFTTGFTKRLKAFEALVRADERNRVWSQKHWTEYEQAIVQAIRERSANERARGQRSDEDSKRGETK
jgi:hypothetical protein